MQLKQATRERTKIRMGLCGAAGSGKTMSALKVAYGLTGSWEKIAVIDTENGASNKYSHLGAFKVLELEPPYTVDRYIQAIEYCEKSGVEFIIIDSISHGWEDVGGLLELHDKLTTAATSGNSFTTWAKITPKQKQFINAILKCKMHSIACCRAKTEYVLSTNEFGKQSPQKIGMKPITREGFDYEMDIWIDINQNHLATCSKDRTGLFADKPAKVLSEEDGVLLAKWANSGTGAVVAPMTAQEFALALQAEAKHQGIGLTKAVKMVSNGNLTSIAEADREQVLVDFIEGKFNNENTV